MLITRFTILLASMFVSTFSFAQAKEVEMADTMRSNGKIYIVVAVCLTILVGLFLYIFSLDRKLSKAEKEV